MGRFYATSPAGTGVSVEDQLSTHRASTPQTFQIEKRRAATKQPSASSDRSICILIRACNQSSLQTQTLLREVSALVRPSPMWKRSACGQVPQTARPRDWPSPKLGHFFAVRRPLPLASPLTVHPSHLEPNCKTSALLEHACIGSATRTPSARARNWPSAADPQPLAS